MAGIVNTAGGKTLPKKGRLGSGAYYPAGVPIQGNVFGPNSEQQFKPGPPAERPFGSPSNAGNGTQFGQNRATTGVGLAHPNSGFNKISQQPVVPPFTYDGRGMQLSPFEPNLVVQPHERNHLPTRKIFGHFRTASGASRTLPSDTAFNRVPPAQRPMAPRPAQNFTLNLVRAKKVGPSFMSRNNMWQDPHQSFNAGKANINGEVGRGRWATVKRGAAG